MPLHHSTTKSEHNLSVHLQLEQQEGSSSVIEDVALITGGQNCSGALSQNEFT